jgi:hypothetical protein
VSIPDADRQFRDVREVYFTIVGQALDWLEGPHPPAGEGSAPGPQPAPPGPSR